MDGLINRMMPRTLEDKHCFIYCGVERCNCERGRAMSDGMTEMRSQAGPSKPKFIDIARAVAQSDVEGLTKAQTHYGESWKKRGGVGAFMMLARKADRLELQLSKADAPFHNDGGRHPSRYDIMEHIEADGRSEGVIDDVRDLRRYLLLVEAEHRRLLNLSTAREETVLSYVEVIASEDATDLFMLNSRLRLGGVQLGVDLLLRWNSINDACKSNGWDVLACLKGVRGTEIHVRLCRRSLMLAEVLCVEQGIPLGLSRDNK